MPNCDLSQYYSIKDVDLQKQQDWSLSGEPNPKEQKRALITGINGQVGSYLAEFLIDQGYQVHGIIRRESSFNTNRLMHLFEDKTNRKSINLKLHYGDLLDKASLFKLIMNIKPDEVYNLAAQSHVKVSFELAEITCNTNGLGPLYLLEAIKSCNQIRRNFESDCFKEIKFYQASTSEMFGGSANQCPQDEKTPFNPRSPYGCSKLMAHWLVVNYRESYNMFAVNGILFNHESPRRGENFVTRKISRAVAEIYLNRREHFELGNLDACRDWGHARDYVIAMWLMLQKREPKDYVISSGQSHSVRNFVEVAFECINKQIIWSGMGLDEVGKDKNSGRVLVKVSIEFFRPSEVDHLLGNSNLAHKELGWSPRTTFKQLVAEMVQSDIELLSKYPSG